MGREMRNPLSVLPIVILLFILTAPTSSVARGPVQWISPPDHCYSKVEVCPPRATPQLGETTSTSDPVHSPDQTTDQP